LNLDDYLPPQPSLAQNRFWLPFRAYHHAVIPLMPRSEWPLDRATREAWNVPPGITDDDIDHLELTPFNVGMLCGTDSGVTVLEVTTHAAQQWLDDQELPRTPHWLSRRSRCYLFNYMPLGQTVTEVRPGLQLLNEGTFVIYPGSMYEDGRLVYWEDSPDEALIPSLPAWLVPPQSLI
jgi:hypothetical protein